MRKGRSFGFFPSFFILPQNPVILKGTEGLAVDSALAFAAASRLMSDGVGYNLGRNGDSCLRIGGKMRATISRLTAAWLLTAALGALILTEFPLAKVGSPFVPYAPALVFAAADPGCQVADDATSKLRNTPWHSYTTAIQGSSGRVSPSLESIFVGGITYTEADGIWYAMPVAPPPPNGNTETDFWKIDPNRVCKHERDEPVDGEKAALYSVHLKLDQNNIEFLMWISNSRGLLLRMDSFPLLEHGDESHTSIRYDYNNVRKPKSVGYDFNNVQKPQS